MPTPRGWYTLAVRGALELLVRALVGLFVRTVFLVTSVRTVGQIITAVARMQTLLAVRTSKLIFGALHLWTVAFIGRIKTVRVTVAQPRSRYADARVRAGVLKVGARFLGFARALAFIGIIATIIFLVTFPGGTNTTSVLAGELRRRTGHVCTAHFIA